MFVTAGLCGHQTVKVHAEDVLKMFGGLGHLWGKGEDLGMNDEGGDCEAR